MIRGGSSVRRRMRPQVRLLVICLGVLFVVACTSDDPTGAAPAPTTLASTTFSPTTTIAQTTTGTPATSVSKATTTTLVNLSGGEREVLDRGVDTVRYSTRQGSLIVLEYTDEPEATPDLLFGGYLEISEGCLVVTGGPQESDSLIALPPELRVNADVTGLNVQRGVNNDFYEPFFIPMGSWIAGEGGSFQVDDSPCPGFDQGISLRAMTDWGLPSVPSPWSTSSSH